MAFYKYDKTQTVADDSILGPRWHPTKNPGLDPSILTTGSGKQATFLCELGHEYMAIIRRGGKCPVCAGRVATIENCLAATHPEILKEWDFENNGSYTPYNLTKNTTKLINLKCHLGHPYQTKVNLWVLGNHCSVCAGKKVDRNLSLAAKHPHLVPEWDKKRNKLLTPWDVFPNSNIIVWWEGPCGHVFKARISNRTAIRKVGTKTYPGSGCPVCRRLSKGKYPAPTKPI